MTYEKMIKRYKRKPLADLTGDSMARVDYSKEVICRILPNREPFLFLDTITGVDLENQVIVGGRHIDRTDPVFKGHFPDIPVYPGVLQLEMLAELFCCLYYFVSRNSVTVEDDGPVNLRATRMHDALLQHGVFPGDDLTIVTKVLELTPLTFTGIGQILNRGNIAIAVIGEFYITQ